MLPSDCTHSLFDDFYRSALGVCLLLTGVLGTSANIWLSYNLLGTDLMTHRSSLLVLCMSVISLLRNILVGFPITATSAFAGGWVLGDTSCSLFAFFSSFIGVFQMEVLTHMCLERYIQVKYFRLGKEMTLELYGFMFCLCTVFAAVYSTPPLLGWGEVARDAGGTRCGVAWTSHTTWQRAYNLLLICLGAVKPIIVMYMAVDWARTLEKQCYTTGRHRYRLMFTKNTIATVIGSLLMWSPQGLLTLWMVVPPMLWGQTYEPPLALAFVATILSELATAVPVVSFIITQPLKYVTNEEYAEGTEEETNKTK